MANKRSEKRQPSRISISPHDQPEDKIEYDCFLVSHRQYPDVLSYIELIGSHSQNVSLMKYAGDFVAFETIALENARTREFGIGTIHHEGWANFSYVKGPEIQHIATIRVSRHVNEIEYADRIGKHDQLTYVYTSDVTGWPSSGMFGLSYKGTISRKKFRNGLNDLLMTKDFHIEADKYYFYDRSDQTTIRCQLASLTVKRLSPQADLPKAADAARIALSFALELKLSPLRKFVIEDRRYRISTFPVDTLKHEERDQTTHQIRGVEWKKLVSHHIRWLYKGKLDFGNIEYSINRYVTAIYDAQFTEGFSAGCEAIESLFSEISSKKTPNSQNRKIVKDLRLVVKKAELPEEIREVCLSKLGSIFSEPLWNSIRNYLKHLCADDVGLTLLIDKMNFFRFRNFASHGRQVKMTWETLLQFELMKLAYQILITRGSGLSIDLPITREIAAFDHHPKTKPATILIWE